MKLSGLLNKEVTVEVLNYGSNMPNVVCIKGTVSGVEGHLLSLSGATTYNAGTMPLPDQVINTLSHAFVRLEIH